MVAQVLYFLLFLDIMASFFLAESKRWRFGRCPSSPSTSLPGPSMDLRFEDVAVGCAAA
jgi:hypothetical protein